MKTFGSNLYVPPSPKKIIKVIFLLNQIVLLNDIICL